MASRSSSRVTGRIGACCRWALAVLACAWIAFCTAIGPLMRGDFSIRQFGWANALVFAATFAVCLGIVGWLVRRPRLPRACRRMLQRARRAVARPWQRLARWTWAATSSWRRIWLVLAIGWMWVPTTLLTAYGADILSQSREFAWAWNQWMGLDQPYIGFFSFVPMDIYPTAHYLWPTDPTYLTDQHNIVLTLVYGGAAAVSRGLTGSNDAGFVVLSALQWLFAGFCVASAADRFLNMPWLRPDYAHPASGPRIQPRDFADPAAGVCTLRDVRTSGPAARLLVVAFFLACPLAVFSTIALTKSPLFAFAFTWWFGVMYELYMTRRSGQRVRRVTAAALVVSCVVMLVSAKYAWYIIAAQVVLSILADRRRWLLYVTALLLPTVVFHGGVLLLFHTGAVISGDSIESRGVQLQMVARVARKNPDAIDSGTRAKLSRVFNLDQMAAAYRSWDADPAKSSGIQSKKVSYRWRTVTPEDMRGFDEAVAEVVRADPLTCLDAFLAKSYGYFDVLDPPYTAASYYVSNTYVQDRSAWIGHVNRQWRSTVVGWADSWGHVPVLGWVTHGNFYVALTLLVGAAEVVLRRWRALSWHMPLLLLMGVMLTAPANNFERHMLPIAFVFGFLCIMFGRDGRLDS
ncbi:DUF6020 family protein [Bifidobacterium cuniculi]|uniref:Uncharacterized protein n=1 Tax=Bifidobacterium cuniculi TaxID=1688 RepID=A0A087AY61_9BIFI|nr:DUF6020 family protein [Bifidobacterium cuniculi]KFI63711.1 hypothetical protein BCUN_1193 [Bifidobacterium cuniculi]